MSKPKTKRFYKTVETAKTETGWAVLLDGHRLKTPGKLPLITSEQSHAELIANEWDAQDDIIRPHLMPLTRLYNVAIERTPENREALIAEIRKYASTDLLCYRTEFPRALAELQAKGWDVWLDWARRQGVALKVGQGVMAIEQDESALTRLAEIASEFDNLQLTLAGHLNAVYGSAVLALAVLKKALTAQEAYDLSRLDFDYQAQHWGEDEEALELSKSTREEVLSLSKLL